MWVTTGRHCSAGTAFSGMRKPVVRAARWCADTQPSDLRRLETVIDWMAGFRCQHSNSAN